MNMDATQTIFVYPTAETAIVAAMNGGIGPSYARCGARKVWVTMSDGQVYWFKRQDHHTDSLSSAFGIAELMGQLSHAGALFIKAS